MAREHLRAPWDPPRFPRLRDRAWWVLPVLGFGALIAFVLVGQPAGYRVAAHLVAALGGTRAAAARAVLGIHAAAIALAGLCRVIHRRRGARPAVLAAAASSPLWFLALALTPQFARGSAAQEAAAINESVGDAAMSAHLEAAVSRSVTVVLVAFGVLWLARRHLARPERDVVGQRY